MSLGWAYAELAHCLRAHSLSLRDNIGKKWPTRSLRAGYVEKLIPHQGLTTGFAYASPCFHRGICLQHQHGEDEEGLEVQEEDEELVEIGSQEEHFLKTLSMSVVASAT